jgi:hypothetical protein
VILDDPHVVVREASVELHSIGQTAFYELKLLTSNAKAVQVACNLIRGPHPLKNRAWPLHSLVDDKRIPGVNYSVQNRLTDASVFERYQGTRTSIEAAMGGLDLVDNDGIAQFRLRHRDDVCVRQDLDVRLLSPCRKSHVEHDPHCRDRSE